tara:strand:+ start:500 stop:1603 length:1104 start_codon:yes stop_codon:yes gene_type:complete
MPGHRPEFGDTLIPTLARGIGNIDSIAREAMRARERQDTRDQELAIDNRRFQAQQENLQEQRRIAKEVRDQENQFRQQQFELSKQNAKRTEALALIDRVKEPFQKEMVAKSFGFTSLAEAFNQEGTIEENKQNALSEFQGYTEPEDIINNSSRAYQVTKFGSPEYNAIQQRVSKAVDDLTITVPELKNMPEYADEFAIFSATAQSPLSSGDQKIQALEQIKALVARAKGETPEKQEDDDVKDFDVDELLSDATLMEFDENVNLGRAEVRKEAKKGFEESTRNVISINKEIRNLESQRKNLANLERARRLPKKGRDRLEAINKELSDARSELRDATNIRQQAGRITGARPGTPMGVISSLGLSISDFE